MGPEEGEQGAMEEAGEKAEVCSSGPGLCGDGRLGT